MSHSPTLFRQRNFQWYCSLPTDDNEQQQMYSDIENDIIEEAYNKKQIEVEIDGDYIIDLERLVQYRKGECHKQFTIKRIQLEKDRSIDHLRIERFGSPVNLILSSSSSSSSISEGKNSDILFHALMKIGDFPRAYFCKEISKTDKTIADVIKAAAEGIVKQGVILGRMHEAESLSQQLLAVEHFGANIIADIDTMLPMEIGNILVNMYTRETFWYRLINRLMRDLNVINIEEMRSIGPFCYLLRCYLNQIPFQPKSSHLLYRGLNMEDEQIQEIIKSNEFVKCLSFTSISTSRKLAELIGNTLLIIELDVDESGIVSEMVYCSSSISDMSAFPDEDEFLIRPPAAFHFIKYECDALSQKHIIYLKT
ncbi:unnamed protein product [Rotaria sp. Silwood1]|nr:unnamed protein product [Rotaria sp. Silwood1]